MREKKRNCEHPISTRVQRGKQEQLARPVLRLGKGAHGESSNNDEASSKLSLLLSSSAAVHNNKVQESARQKSAFSDIGDDDGSVELKARTSEIKIEWSGCHTARVESSAS